MKASAFMASMVIVVGVFAVLFAYAGEVFNNYGVTVPDQHNATFQKLIDMASVDDATEELKGSIMSEEESPNTINTDENDVLGKFFARGVRTILKVPKTIGVFSSMVDALLSSNVNLLGTATVSIRFIVVSLIILGIVFLLVSAKLKWPM